MCTHRGPQKRLLTGRMYFDHHIFAAGWILLSLLNRDLLSSYEAKIKVYTINRERKILDMLTSILFDWRMSLRSIGLSRWLIYKCRAVNIRTISPPMFRSCSPVSQTPVKLGSQSRTWSQQLVDRQMPKSWVSAKSDPAIIDLTLDTCRNRWTTKTNVSPFCIILISRIFYKRLDRLTLTFKLKWPSTIVKSA